MNCFTHVVLNCSDISRFLLLQACGKPEGETASQGWKKETEATEKRKRGISEVEEKEID